MRVVVTGGSGCLGTPLVRRLASRGFDVRVLTRNVSRCEDLAALPGVSIWKGSVAELDSLIPTCAGAEVVFHLAAHVHSWNGSAVSVAETFATNVDGTRNVLRAARRGGVKRIVFTSTVGVYASGTTAHVDDDTPTMPLSAYAESKWEAEQLILHQADLEGVVLRLPVAYGPKDRGNVARLIAAIARRRFFLVQGAPGLKSMVASENAAEAADVAGIHGTAPGQVFLVADARPVTIQDFVAAVNAALERDWRPITLPRRAAQGIAVLGSALEAATGRAIGFNRETYRKLYGCRTITSSKARRVLGLRAPYSFCEGIADEVRWLVSQRLL